MISFIVSVYDRVPSLNACLASLRAQSGDHEIIVCANHDNPDKLRAAFERSVPLGRIGQPDDLEGAICFLSSDDAAYITGQTISVSGGLTMAG